MSLTRSLIYLQLEFAEWAHSFLLQSREYNLNEINTFGEARAICDMLNHNASREFMSSISGERIVRRARASN